MLIKGSGAAAAAAVALVLAVLVFPRIHRMALRLPVGIYSLYPVWIVHGPLNGKYVLFP